MEENNLNPEQFEPKDPYNQSADSNQSGSEEYEAESFKDHPMEPNTSAPEPEVTPEEEQKGSDVIFEEKSEMSQDKLDSIFNDEGEQDPKPECPDEQTAESRDVVYRWDYVSQHNNDQTSSKQNTRRGVIRFAIILGSAFLVAIALLVGVLLLSGNGGPSTGSTSISSLYEDCFPSYVAISTTSLTSTGTGSGIIYTTDGYIITNYHVVDGADTIEVITYNDKTYTAEYIAGDELNDIAVIKIDAKGLRAARIGSSADSHVGDRVMAIGTPYSINYRGTMTSGSISFLNRKYMEQNDSGLTKRVLYLIQTDTSINPGNSGGPLFNMNGEVIGIVSLKMVNTGYEGIGFAIPIESVIGMINEAVNKGTMTSSGGAVEGAAIGISGFDCLQDTTYLLTDTYHYILETDEDGRQYIANYYPIKMYVDDTETLEQLGIGDDWTSVFTKASGVYIQATTPGFDSASKLQNGDIIIEVNGEPCTGILQIQTYVSNHKVGDTIDLTVQRGDEQIKLQIRLGKSALMN